MATAFKRVETVVEDCEKKLSDLELTGKAVAAKDLKQSLDSIADDLAKCLAKANEPDETKRLYGAKQCQRIRDVNLKYETLLLKIGKLPKEEIKTPESKPEIKKSETAPETSNAPSVTVSSVTATPVTATVTAPSATPSTTVSPKAIPPVLTPTPTLSSSSPTPALTTSAVSTSARTEVEKKAIAEPKPNIEAKVTPTPTTSTSTPTPTSTPMPASAVVKPVTPTKSETESKVSMPEGITGFTKALNMIKVSCDDVQFQAAILTLQKCVTNIIKNPTDVKFRRIRKDHDLFHKRLGSRAGGIECLEALGFTHQDKLLILEPTAERWNNLKSAESIIEEILKPGSTLLSSAGSPSSTASSTTSASSSSSTSSSTSSTTAPQNPLSGLASMMGQLSANGELSQMVNGLLNNIGGGGGGGGGGLQGMMANPMFQQLLNNPERMLGMMQSPMIQNLFQSPDTLNNMIGNFTNQLDPGVRSQVQNLLGENPAQMLESILPQISAAVGGGAGAQQAPAQAPAPDPAPAPVPDAEEAESEESDGGGGGGEEENVEDDEERLIQEALRLSMQEDAQRNRQQRQ